MLCGIIAGIVSVSGLCRITAVLILCAGTVVAQSHVASDLAHQVLSATLNPADCYRVHDVQIRQSDVLFYLTDGYLIFGKPVNGAPLTAVFSTDVEGGDAEVVLLPPDRAERRTMAASTGSPNLDEHFTLGVFFFTDGAARDLAQRVRTNPTSEAAPTIGALMTDRWNLTVTNLMSGFETRMVLDLLTGGSTGEGFFDAALRGRKLGDFDVVHDARGVEQIAVGKATERDGALIWDTWTRFVSSERKGMPQRAPEEEILRYNIDASMDPSLAMHCITKMRIRATPDSHEVLPFELTADMHVLSAKIDGVSAEVYQRESPRSGLVQNSGNETFLVIPPHPLDPGSEHDVEIVHEGKVVMDTGSKIYFVSARGTWYPGRGSQFASYDVTYHYPATLDLVSAGVIKEDHTENGVRTTHRVPEGRMRLLGFNLGKYVREESEKNGVSLEVSANREFEPSIRPPAPAPVMVPNLVPTPRSVTSRLPQMVEPAALPMDPGDRIAAISTEIQGAIEYFRSMFGDPPLRHIEVSPVPGRFGQGFAGMIYLPTLMYLDPYNMPARASISQTDQDFFGQLLRVHETAHQWWGNIVTTNSYHHEWLMESLANYSAVMYLESKMGSKAVEKALDVYRRELLVTGPDGATAESQGPVVEGRRLESSVVPGAANAIVYGKGTWIIHMLRRKMGDANFVKMLSELRRRYQLKTITTDEFRELCSEFMPAGSSDRQLVDFFDQWVYDVGMPSLKLTFSVTGRKLTGTVTQTDAPADFSVTIPVEIRAGAGKPVIKQVRTASGAVKFTVDVAGPGAKATLDPGWSILRR